MHQKRRVHWNRGECVQWLCSVIRKSFSMIACFLIVFFFFFTFFWSSFIRRQWPFSYWLTNRPMTWCLSRFFFSDCRLFAIRGLFLIGWLLDQWRDVYLIFLIGLSSTNRVTARLTLIMTSSYQGRNGIPVSLIGSLLGHWHDSSFFSLIGRYSANGKADRSAAWLAVSHLLAGA